MKKYYLKVNGLEKEVDKKEWILAERRAGFRPKMASNNPRYMDVCATGGFGNDKVDGRTESVSELECPVCGAIIDVYYSEEYSTVTCHICNIELKCTWKYLAENWAN